MQALRRRVFRKSNHYFFWIFLFLPLQPRLTWRDGISGPYKCFLVTILTFNAICFAYSCMHLALLAFLVPKNISSPPTTAFYWLIVGSVMTFFVVLILLMVMDRCPWVRLQSHQWRWSFSECGVQLAWSWSSKTTAWDDLICCLFFLLTFFIKSFFVALYLEVAEWISTFK